MISDNDLRELRRPATDWREDPASPAQIHFIQILVEDREVPKEWIDKIDKLADEGIKKGKAGEIIQGLKKLPLRSAQDRSKNQPSPEDVPAGRYCVQTGNEPNDLSFFRVWRAKDRPEIVRVYRIAGPNEYKLVHGQSHDALKRIYRAGAGDAAILYGRKIGRCSVCNTRLTNRTSRELGIGPVCGGRYYADWHTRVREARQAIRDRGQDPNENV